jgi:acyl-CoA synthetase (AMP-forming)/AMP-acid ligase II
MNRPGHEPTGPNDRVPLPRDARRSVDRAHYLTLMDLFEHNRRHFSAANALTVDGVASTYDALGRRVDDIGQVLAGYLERGDRVAIWLPNSATWVAGFIAASGLDAVAVPVNTRLTGAELRTIVSDAGARVLLTTSQYRGRQLFEEAVGAFASEASAPTILCAEEGCDPRDWAVWSDRPHYESTEVPEGLLCIQYTSGTTSRPKGVMLTGGSYLRTAAFVANAQLLTPATQFLSGSPFFHCSGSMHAITVCQVAGCTLHTMTQWDPELAAMLTARFRCTASHNLFFRDVLALDTGRMRELLRTMRVAAAVGTPELLTRVHDELDIPGISNLYGMTETAGNFTMCFPDDALAARVHGNGKPQPGNLLRIVDPATGAVCAPGKDGEIQMGGPTIALGYFRAPETTRDAFTADNWLRSGDLGRLGDDGALTYVARLKDVIRTGGENVSPTEIEEALLDVQGIQEACILPAPDERLDEVPVAVVTLMPGAAPDWPTVMQTLRTRLAGYKVPRRIYVIDTLPKTATSKVQRAAVKSLLSQGKITQLL